MSKKADQIEFDRRIEVISDWLLDGESVYKIVHYSSEKWQVGRRQVEKYIRLARTGWKKAYQKDFKDNLDYHLLARRRLYNSCVREKDRSNARQILNDMAKIQGIMVDKVEHSGGLNIEILRKEMAEKKKIIQEKLKTEQQDDGAAE